ncbi:MAG: rhizopine-binding protein, partial [Mesorhizobium sp.]
MKKLLISTALAALMATAFAAVSTGAFAAKLGVSIVNFDNNFQTLLMHGMQARAKEKGAEIQVEDAQNDVAKQLDQVK